jgi:hypothetical protein
LAAWSGLLPRGTRRERRTIVSFRWIPGAEDEIKRAAVRQFEAKARPVVVGTVCPDHGKSPKLVRRGDNLTIENFCCKKVVEIASKSAGLKDLEWYV